jgi:hypothetical protein
MTDAAVTQADELLVALEPVRVAVTDDGRRDSARTLAVAQARADATMDTAREEARAMTEHARTQGRSDADAYLATQQSRAMVGARSRTLESEQAGYQWLRSTAREAVIAWARSRGPALRPLLEQAARAALGPDTAVEESGDGGVIGRVAGRRVDLSLNAVTDRAFDEVLNERAAGRAP